jgi:hypothetical protein
MDAGDDWISLHQQISIRCVQSRLRRRGTALSGNLDESAAKSSDAVSYPLVLRLLLTFFAFFFLWPSDEPLLRWDLDKGALGGEDAGADVACANRVDLG